MCVVSVLVVGVLLQAGCATVFHGRMQSLEIVSDPPDAYVFVDGERTAMTPAKIWIERKHAHMIRLEAEGYDPYQVRTRRRPSLWLVPDLALVALYGYGIQLIADGSGPHTALYLFFWSGQAVTAFEYVTGSLFHHSPTSMDLTLSKTEVPLPQEATGPARRGNMAD